MGKPTTSQVSDAGFSRPPRNWRSAVLVVVVTVVWVVLAGRLLQLQWLGRDEFVQRANRQQTVRQRIPARPGEIVDRHNRLLATTVTTHSLYVVPNRIPNAWNLALAVGQSLQMDPDELFERIAARREKSFLWVKRRLSDEEVQRIRELDLPVETWGFREEYARRYPQGALAAHVLGLRDIDGAGRGGIEQTLDPMLRGRDGYRILVRDARGRVLEVRQEAAETPRRGRTVVLTIDAVIQLYAERELDGVMSQWKPQRACAVVLDPKNGEILAMASRPTFDPNRPGDAPDDAWKNLAVSAIFEPGSTFKPFIVASALEQECIALDEQFDCEQGAYRMGRRVLHDTHPYGRLSVTDVLVKSSNIGMAKIGERLTNEGLYDSAILFGFGRRTGIELPGELRGIVRPLRDWNLYSTGSVPMGQEIAVTPLQLISAHAALANGGQLVSPHLLLATTDGLSPPQSGNFDRSHPILVSKTVSPEVANWLVEGPMTEVVRRGTGRHARLDDYEVFGKTGTAQKPDPETGKYSSQLHVSSFLCGAPAEDPRVLVLILVDEPTVGSTHYGGTIAAPAAASLLRKSLIYLRVPTKNSPARTAGNQQSPSRPE
jgi:cell division protein FtsI (penicillin-binding protein 3)